MCDVFVSPDQSAAAGACGQGDAHPVGLEEMLVPAAQAVKSLSRGVVPGLVLALFAALAGWWGACADRSDDSLARLQRGGTLRVGYAVEPPYAWVDGQGRILGEAPELAQRVAQHLGATRIEWVQTEFAALIPGLQQGRFDVVAAGMFITPERARVLRFSRPTLRVAAGWLSQRPGTVTGLDHAAAVAQPHLRIAALAQSVELQRLRDLQLPAARLIEVPDARAGAAAVLAGRADALALSWPTVRHLAAGAHGRLLAEPARRPQGDAPGSLAYTAFEFRLADAALARAWDAALGPLLGDAEHLALLARLGLGPDDLPDRASAAEVLAP